jgi:hypothetical protein
LEINRSIGDRSGHSMVLSNLAGLDATSGELDTAERTAKESIRIAREIGTAGIVGSGQSVLIEVALRRGRDAEARAFLREFASTLRALEIPLHPVALFYGLLELRNGDRARGLGWIGHVRAHDPHEREIAMAIDSFRDLIRGSAPEAEVEAALKAGESLTLEEILAEAERE